MKSLIITWGIIILATVAMATRIENKKEIGRYAISCATKAYQDFTCGVLDTATGEVKWIYK